MKEVNDIEQRLQYLYSCKNAEELRSAVSKIRKDMVSLRDAQLKSKNTTEILPDGEASRLLQSRYQNLNDMIHELDAVDLNDNTETSKKDKKQWLVDKLYELNIITYDDTYEDQDE